MKTIVKLFDSFVKLICYTFNIQLHVNELIIKHVKIDFVL